MRERSISGEIKPALFSLIMLAVALGLFALPYPSPGLVKRMVMIERSDARIAIVGPSTISYVSMCDTDKRDIPRMLSDLTGAKVLDLSVGGQALSDTLNLAAAAGNSSGITDVVLPLAHPYIDESTTPPYRALVSYKAITPSFKVFAATDAADLWSGLRGSASRVEQGYRFQGVDYPDYRVLSVGEFAREKQLMGCPEPVTHDSAFTRSYYWWTHVAVQQNDALYGLVADLQTELFRKGKRLHVVILPTNLGLIGRLDPSWPAIVEEKQATLAAELEKRGVHAIDLSRGFSPDEFSTQWCGCIHLAELGRRHMAQEIAASIDTPPPAAAETGR